MLEAAYRRPTPDYETIRELGHPDHVFVPVEVDRGRGYEGFAGYRAWFGEIGETLPWSGRLEGAIEAGPRTVIAQTTMQMQGGASEIEFDQLMWLVMTLADGKVARTESYLHPEEALRAAAGANP